MSDSTLTSTGISEPEPELERLRHDLAQTKTELEELQRRKSGLLAMAVHDLRTPLAIIQGFAQLLAADLEPTADSTVGEYITNIMAHSDSLGNMVENLVALDQFERSETHLQIQRSNLNDLVEDAIAQVEGLTKIKNLKVLFHPSVAPAEVEVDEDLIHRALYNLLSHVIKYARPNTQVDITVDTASPYHRVRFHDPNRHLSAEIITRLFDLVDMNQDGMASLRGMDMGLVLTRLIAEQHAGRVEAAAKKGRGMTLDLRLPAIQSI